MKPTKAQRKWVMERIMAHKKRLRLDWEIEVNYPEKDCWRCDEPEDAFCCVSINEPYSDAKIVIHDRFWEQDDDERDDSLLHELCHLVTSRLNENARMMLEGKLVTEKQLIDDFERVTQHLVRIVK